MVLGILPSVICVQTSCVKVAIPIILVKVVSAKITRPMMVIIVRVTTATDVVLFHPQRKNVPSVIAIFTVKHAT